MFDFERIFICRNLGVADSGFMASGIGFSHPRDVPHILLFGHILGARLARDVRVYVEIETSQDLEIGPVLQQTYSLRPGGNADRRMMLARIPVAGLLDPRAYQAIINVEHRIETRVGFEIT